MANTLAALLKYTGCGLHQNITKTCFKILQPQFVRCLYSKTSLGIDGYLQQRERTKLQLTNIGDKFKTKMEEYSAEDSKNMIFTEDLKNMIHIAETDDIELIIKMMKKFNSQNKELRFGNFVFGPVVMRMFYTLNKPDEALQSFNLPELQGFFDQLASYQLLMDLLYENQKYKEMLEVFEVIKNKQLEGAKYPRNIIVLTFAACFKMNTEESWKYALDLWTALIKVGHNTMRRASTFCAGLALNQGQPSAALEIIATVKNQNYTTIRNLKVSSFIDLGRLDEALVVLKSVLNTDTPENKQQTFNKDIVEKMKNAVEKSDNIELKTEFSRIEKYFLEQGHMSEMTLDEQLCSEIVAPSFVFQNQRQPEFNRYQRNSRMGRPNQFRPNNRPGLSELQ